MMFPRLTDAFLGFMEYPKDPTPPDQFSFSKNTEFLYSSATDYSRKVGMPWSRKHPRFWFVKVLSVPAEESVEIYSEESLKIHPGLMQITGLVQKNPSLYEGEIVGPFESEESINKWYQEILKESLLRCLDATQAPQNLAVTLRQVKETWKTLDFLLRDK